jgi:hypothetical protein
VEISDALKQRLEGKEGVTEVLIVPERQKSPVQPGFFSGLQRLLHLKAVRHFAVNFDISAEKARLNRAFLS